MTKRTHEFWVSDPVDEAVRRAKITLKNLGALKAVVPNQHVVGTVAFGVQEPAVVRISWRPENEPELDPALYGGKVSAPRRALPGTMLTLEVSHEEGGEAAVRSAIERFEEAYRHFDQPDYTPDRLGILPVTIIGFIVVLLLLAFLLARRTNVFKPEPTPKPSATAVAQ
jgi:hypothetical protein